MKKSILSAALMLSFSTHVVVAETPTPAQEQAKKAYEAKAAQIRARIDNATKHLMATDRERDCFDMEMAKDYRTISDGHFDLGEFDAAIIWGLRALKVQMKLLKADDPALADAYADLGNKYYMPKENPTAILYLNKALEIYGKDPKTDPLKIADTYELIASIFINLGDYEKSLAYAQKCLALRQKHLPKEDEALKRAVMNIDFLKEEIKNKGCKK